MKCIFCKTEEHRADKKSKAVLCGACTAKLTGSPAAIGKVPAGTKAEKPAKVAKVRKTRGTAAKAVTKTAGFGRGWHLKKHFTAPDGTVYSFGKPV
jgi:hypothetical protein